MAYNYGGRNGVSQIIRFTQLLCKIYLAYSARINLYISNSDMSEPNKATVLAWLGGATSACTILELIKVGYEA